MTQPQTSPAPAEALDLSFDLDLPCFCPEGTDGWSEPSAEAWDALMRTVTDAEIRDLPLPGTLLPFHADEPLDLSF